MGKFKAEIREPKIAAVVTHAVTVGAGVVDYQQIAPVNLRQRTVNGELVAVLAQRAGNIVNLVTGRVFLAHDG